MTVPAEELRKVPLFSGMTDRSVHAVGALARETHFATGDELVRQGDPGDFFIILVEGDARVTQDGQALRSLGPGDFLGEISLIDGTPRSATVTATSPVTALVVDRLEFGQLMEEFPHVRLEILNALTQRLRAHAPGLD
jgi:CRP/FNR family transcriptional regulator, cyclic AMP receptor protein